MKYSVPVLLVLAFSLIVSPLHAADQPPSVGAPAGLAPGVPVPPPPPKDATVPLNEAIKAYKDGKYKEALAQIDLAQNSIRRQHAELYRSLLPDNAPSGWQVLGSNDGAAAMGGQA